MTDERYQRYFEHFNPDLYNPRGWARAAREAGMKYFVVTAKHHEGFCLWDSQFTDFKATNTPCGKDLLRPLIEAFRDEGLKVGFYYSLIDWHHPEFPIDGIHPMRNHTEAAEWNKTREMPKYAQYMRDQVRELLTGFGKIDVLWFDFSYPDNMHRGLKGKGRDDWESEKLLKLVRELQPHVIVDNRLDLPREFADIHTPEQYQPREWEHVEGKPVVWEACQTFSGSWGYHRDETSWKSPQQLIQMLVNTVATGGNLLMNVGPTARGTFDERALEALGIYAEWMALHSRSIYGCTQSEFEAPVDCRLTQNGNRLYLHIYAWPFQHLHLDGLGERIEYAQLLNDGSEVQFRVHANEKIAGGTATLQLPVRKPEVIVPVVELFLK
jgi:alpha-L-fucosidase